MIVVIDNYDSFTYNLVQRIGELDPGKEVVVFRNDRVTCEELAAYPVTHLIISPGPGRPENAGVSNDAIRRFAGKAPILGVCLGHQCIGHVFGAAIVRADRVMHGKTSEIRHGGAGIFRGVSNPFTATRYHSLMIDRGTLSGEFEVTAWTDRDELMGIRHKGLAIEGVQFHPESFKTEVGPQLMANFLGL